MKLFVIILCLMSERYLTHQFANKRFKEFDIYTAKLKALMGQFFPSLQKPIVTLAAGILLPVVLLALVYKLTSNLAFGFVGLLIQVAVFFYCLGPQNPFYPKQTSPKTSTTLKHYFIKMNVELFAPIFWFLLGGPVVLLAYRLVDLYSQRKEFTAQAKPILEYFDWLPIRLEAILYLFVGHFQEGMKYFSKMLLAKPEHNAEVLGHTAVYALKEKDETADITQAEHMVEHALIVLLVFISLLTLVAWL